METYQTLWVISLVIGLVVIGVVGFLLNRIMTTADKIDVAASKIWTQGKLTANNTIQIPLFLQVTNKVVSKIYTSAVSIIGGRQLLKNMQKDVLDVRIAYYNTTNYGCYTNALYHTGGCITRDRTGQISN